MPRTLLIASLAAALTTTAAHAAPLEKTTSKSVADASAAFVEILGKKGATVFAVVDHAAGAEKAGMELAPSTLVIFGNPRIGTPIMQAAPEMGIVLPMKALFLDDGDGGTRILYTNIAEAAEAHGVDPDHAAVLKAGKALDGLTGAAAK